MQELRDKLQKEHSHLKVERTRWEPYWSEVRDHVRTTRPRFFFNDKDKLQAESSDYHVKLLDPQMRKASRILRSGLHGGMTSPARPWFKLGTFDPDRNDREEVSEFFFLAEHGMREIFRASNVYSSLQHVYGEAANYATGPMFIVRDSKDIIRCYPMEVGEYWLGADERGMGSTLHRRCSMTVDQMAREFGVNNLSESTRRAYDNGNYQQTRNVIRALRPRRERDPNKIDNQNMPNLIAAWEEGSPKEQLLVISGANENVMVSPRWETAGYEPYGVVSPGLDAVSEGRQLQWYAIRKAQAVDTSITPPPRGPSTLQAHEKNFFPGGVTYVDDIDLQRGGFRPVYESKPDMMPMLQDIGDVRTRINEDYYVDLFMMFQNPGVVTGDKPTAEQIMRQHEEKMVMLGPVLDLLGRELLQPLIARTFQIMMEGNLLPPVPEALQGQPIKVEYISTLAQAQKAVGVGSIERTIGFIGTVSTLDEGARYRLNADEAIDEFIDQIGAPPKIVRSKDDANELRSAEAEAAQQAQMMQAAPQMAQTAKLLSEANARGDQSLAGAGVL